MDLDTTLLHESVSVEGPADAPAILLVHGVHLGRYSWTPHVAALRNDFRIATIDLPRHGTMVNVPFTQENIDAQLRYVVDEVFKRPALLAGYSLGGYAITQFSERVPQASTGLFLAGCTMDPTEWRSSAYNAIVSAAQHIPRPFFDASSRMFFRMTLKPELAEAIVRNPFDPRIFTEAHALLDGRYFSRMLREYPHPIMIVNGQYDVVFRPQQDLFAQATGAQHRIIPKSDHVFPLRRPDEFCAILREFSESLILPPQPAQA